MSDSMNFLFVPYIQQIPQWKECYYDYSTLNKLIQFIEGCVFAIIKIEDILKNHKSKINKQKLLSFIQRLIIMIQSQRESFYKYSTQQSHIISKFIQLKIYEIQQKLNKYNTLLSIVGRNNHQLILLYQNLYIQIHYLNNAAHFNIAKQIATINTLNFILRNFVQFQNQFYLSRTMRRMNLEVQKLKRVIDLQYQIYNQQIRPDPKNFQQNFHKKYKKVQLYEPLMLGFFMGGLCAFLGIAIQINNVNHLQLGTNQIFTQHFQVWRGASEIIFYIWILGLNVLFFEKSQINFKLIFHFQKHNLPHSRYIFLLASIFSFIYLTLLTLFFLDKAGTLKTNFHYYGHIFWLIFVVYIFQPFPILHQQGRFYMLRMIAHTLLPCFYPMNFLTIWIAEQMVSLSQPMTDFFYTVCFLISKDAAATATISANFNSALVMTLFLYRVIQNSRMWYQITQAREDKVYDFWAPPFLGAIRATFGFLAGLTSMLYRLKAFPNALVLWIVIAVFATLVSWYVDVRGDWGLFQHQSKNILRQKLLFPRQKYIYYFLGIFNLILRTGWVFTISSFQLGAGTGVWPLIFIMIISFVQIFRRGIWNLLRLQFQHIKNCGQYQATIRDGHILKHIQKQALQIEKQRIGLKSQYSKPTQQIISSRIELDDKKIITKSYKKQEQIRKVKQLEVFKLKLGLRNKLRNQIEHNLKIDQHYLKQIRRQMTVLQVSTLFLQTVHLIDDE